MKKPLSLLLPVALFFTVSAVAGEFPDDWTWDTGSDAPHRAEHATLEGKTMPGIDVTGWMNGQVTSADMKGKVVVLDFYASWCPVCMSCISDNNYYQHKYKDKGLLLVGICTNKNGQENMAQVVQSRGILYPTARDPKLVSENTWHVHYYPTYAVIDRKGIVRCVGLQPQYLDLVIQKLLAEPVPKN